MISRHWKGVVKSNEADHYIDHLRRETFPRLSNIPGFIRATILKRAIGHGIEFQIVTTWESMEAIKQFTGESVQVAVVPPTAQEMMIEYDREVVHYEVVVDE